MDFRSGDSFSGITTLVLILAVISFVASACNLTSEGEDGEVPAEGQTDQGRQDESVGHQVGVAKDSPCYNEYYPLTPEVVRKYGVFTGKTADDEDYREPPTIYLKKQDLSGGGSFTEVLEFSNGIEPSVSWNCAPEGLRNDQAFGYLKGPDGSNEVEVVSSSGVYLPRDNWRVGAKWSYEVKVKIKSGASGGGDLTNDAKIEYEIVSMNDRVKVPGGEFTAARLDTVSTMDVGVPGRPNTPVTLRNSEWYSPEVGLVKLVQTGFNTATTVYLGDEKR